MGIYLWETKETHNLPSEYQEVEYIDSNGSWSSISWPYINTWYSWTTNNGEVKFKYRPLAFGNAYYIDRFGGAYMNNNRAFALYICYSSPYVWLWGNDIQLTWNTFSVGTDYEFDITANNWNANISINGVNRTETYSWSIGNNYIYSIFAWHETNGFEYRCSARLYYFKMYEWWTLVRDFVPCYRKQDTEIWLYDLVNDQFYANAWTWTFTKWPDVPTEVQKELQNAYIGGVWQPWANTVAYYPLKADTNDESWNSNDMTNSWIAFWTYDGIECAYLDGSASASKSWSLFTWNPTFTASIWLKTLQNAWSPRAFGSGGGTNSFTFWLSNVGVLNTWWWTNDRNTWYTLSTNTRYNIIFAYSNWAGTVYINGNSVYSWTRSPTIWNTSTLIWDNHSLANKWYWYLSNAIFENEVRTAQEVLDYYNLTKWNYWIS